MPSKPFGEDLWNALQSVKVDLKDGIQAPVTANGNDGINVGGVDVSAQGTDPSEATPGLLSRLLARLRRR